MRFPWQRRKAFVPQFNAPDVPHKIAPPIEYRYVHVYQYQVELDGGKRVGPQFMHRDEARAFLERNPIPNANGRIAHIITLTDYISEGKLRGVAPEVVEIGQV